MQREQTCGCQAGGGGRGGKDWEFGVSRCKLVCIEWRNTKVLLSGTGNYIQYPVIGHNGKDKKYRFTKQKRKQIDCHGVR